MTGKAQREAMNQADPERAEVRALELGIRSGEIKGKAKTAAEKRIAAWKAARLAQKAGA